MSDSLETVWYAVIDADEIDYYMLRGNRDGLCLRRFNVTDVAGMVCSWSEYCMEMLVDVRLASEYHRDSWWEDTSDDKVFLVFKEDDPHTEFFSFAVERQVEPVFYTRAKEIPTAVV